VSTHEAPTLSRDDILAATARPISRGLIRFCGILALVGIAVFVIGALRGEERVWHALHFNWLYFTVFSSAGVVFVAVQRITTARWSRAVIRFVEGYVAFLPVAFILLLLLVFVGRDHVFPWATEAPVGSEKQRYLSPGFFSARVVIAFGIIMVLSLWYIYTSVRLDVGHIAESGSAWARGIRARMRSGFGEERRELHSTHSRQGKLAVFLVMAYAFGWTVLAWDLSMTLDLHFQSTLYGWWFFMGGWLTSLMVFALLTMRWRKFLDAYDLITEHHFHDIGKLCFAFTAFWGYLTFGQYLVIWYGNLAEETHFMRLRLIDPWVPLTVTVVLMVFVLPFFGLLSRAAKVFLPTLTLFALSSAVGLWLLRYIEVYPSVMHAATNIPFGIWEIGVTLMYVGLWGFCYASFMNAFPRMRVTLMTSPYRDEVQVPVNAKTMRPLPAHE
jgi:hypothetical protein